MKESGTVMGSSDKDVNHFESFFGEEIELIFPLILLKDLIMTGVIYYYWKFNSDLWILSNVGDQY